VTGVGVSVAAMRAVSVISTGASARWFVRLQCEAVLTALFFSEKERINLNLETVQTVSHLGSRNTRLKPGVNGRSPGYC
jgi:hypothetical protein